MDAPHIILMLFHSSTEVLIPKVLTPQEVFENPFLKCYFGYLKLKLVFFTNFMNFVLPLGFEFLAEILQESYIRGIAFTWIFLEFSEVYSKSCVWSFKFGSCQIGLLAHQVTFYSGIFVTFSADIGSNFAESFAI